jgi:FixJ family two-component response regulator
MATVLIVDDAIDEVRKAIRPLSRKYEFVYSDHPDEALRMVKQRAGEVSAAVVDIVFDYLGDSPRGQQSGLILIDTLHKEYPDLPIVALTAHATNTLNKDALERGAFCFITKGMTDTIKVLERALEHAVEFAHSKRLNRDFADRIKSLEGELRFRAKVGRWVGHESVDFSINSFTCIERGQVGQWVTQDVVPVGTKKEIEVSARVMAEERIEAVGSVEVESNILAALLAKIKIALRSRVGSSVSTFVEGVGRVNVSRDLVLGSESDESWHGVVARRDLIAPIYDIYDVKVQMECSACRQEGIHTFRITIPTGEWRHRLEATYANGERKTWEF